MEILNNADDGIVIDGFANWVFYAEFLNQCLVDND